MRKRDLSDNDYQDEAHNPRASKNTVADPTDDNRGFRFRRSALDRIVADRELMLRQAEQRAREAEERAKRLEEELRKDGNGGSPGRADPGPQSEQVGDAAGLASLPHEQLEAIVGAVVSAAEELRGRSGAEGPTEAAQVEEVRRKLVDRTIRAREWRERLDPALKDARARLEAVGREVHDLPDKLADALRPLADSVREADASLGKLEGLEGPVPIDPSQPD